MWVWFPALIWLKDYFEFRHSLVRMLSGTPRSDLSENWRAANGIGYFSASEAIFLRLNCELMFKSQIKFNGCCGRFPGLDQRWQSSGHSVDRAKFIPCSLFSRTSARRSFAQCAFVSSYCSNAQQRKLWHETGAVRELNFLLAVMNGHRWSGTDSRIFPTSCSRLWLSVPQARQWSLDSALWADKSWEIEKDTSIL
jgi:hypothetical protein